MILTGTDNRNHQYRLWVITVVGWKYYNKKWTILILHCCQLNCTLSYDIHPVHFISFLCHLRFIKVSIVSRSFTLSINDKYKHSHTYTHMRSLSHNPAHSVLKWELWHFFELKCVPCFLPSASFSSGKSKHCVPIAFPLRLTHNEALCHCHVALSSCRSMRNALKVIITDKQGEGRRE